MTYQIKAIILRKCHADARFVCRYSTGHVDPPSYPVYVVEISNGSASGFGEFVPISVLYKDQPTHRETLDEWAMLQRVCHGLIGQDCRELRTLIPADLEREAANPVVDGIDFAMHDLVGRIAWLPVWSLLGGRRQTWVWGMPVVHTDSPEAMAERAESFYRRGGYRWFKLKPNGNADRDREAMIKIRERTHAEVRFFVDPNYALKLDAAGVVDYMNALEPHGLDTCEDPIDADWAAYRWIQERTSVRLMLDAKARTPASVMEIAQHRSAAAVNIHANWASGFVSAVAKAAVAAAAGIDVVIGSTAYLGWGAAAYQTLSSVIPGRHICEQVNAGDEIERIAVKAEYRTEDGKIHISDAPGLGVDVDRDALAGLTDQEITIR